MRYMNRNNIFTYTQYGCEGQKSKWDETTICLIFLINKLNFLNVVKLFEVIILQNVLMLGEKKVICS